MRAGHNIAIVALTPGGFALAERVAALTEGQVHATAKSLSAKSDAATTPPPCVIPIDGRVAEHIRALYLGGQTIVGLCAAGILIRALAPVIGSKGDDPPVLAISEDGRSVVPLLGGHHGANTLAATLAAQLDAHAALTTAGDVVFGLALDAPPAGWRLENPTDAKPAMAALLAGAVADISGMQDWLEPLAASGRVQTATDAVASDPTVVTVSGCEPLVYRRKRLAVGVGCARDCEPDELIGLIAKTLAEFGYAQSEVARIVSIDVKADEAAVHAAAKHFGQTASFFTATELNDERARLENPSDVVYAEVGCHGVAEGAALRAAGPDAVLSVPKQKTANATCAVSVIGAGGSSGRQRGRLAVVGIGPGQSEWRTPEVSRLISAADLLVGYGLYIDLLGPAASGKERVDFPLGGEEDRCRYALEAAGEGRAVALVCSGDGGIYAMGALVCELLDRPADAGGVSESARRVDIIHAPGVSALQAASARVGALLGHDFCAISLSDLLTPRDDIVRRVRAAGDGDFVVAFYNPVSRKRRTLLAEARDILLAHRPFETPVLLASNLGRSDEKLRLRQLGELSVDEVDML
ncbi:MAG: cobalamin biosynthesis protein, partial [Pseudomonadota bacterium]